MGVKMMVVDDSLFVLEEMRFLLKDTGFEIAYYCKSGEEALAQYGVMEPDIVTMDIILPGMDGLATTEQLLQKYPQARVVMVSSLAYDDTMDEANRLGAKGFIFKPFDKQQLLETLSRAAGLA